jgi:pimeloyl-ACP methyl ester carboxylesterase
MLMNVLTAEGTANFVTVQGLKLNYHEAGEGPPLILLHGGGPGASAWSNYGQNFPELSEHFRVVAIDMPHFGKSDKPPDRYVDVHWYAQVLADAMRSIGMPKAHIIGNSMGGAIAIELALAAPEMIDRLVLMGAAASVAMFTPSPSEGAKHLMGYYQGEGPTRAKLEAFIRCMIFDQSRITSELVDARYAASTVPELMVERQMGPAAAALHNLWRRVDKVPHKTLLIYGRDDRVVPWDTALLLLRLMPNADLHVFSHCGHWAQWERAAEFNGIATNFLTGPES